MMHLGSECHCLSHDALNAHARGVTVYTDYDLAGRPCQKTHMAGAAHHYTGKLSYNGYGLPNEFTEYVGAARARYTTGFS